MLDTRQLSGDSVVGGAHASFNCGRGLSAVRPLRRAQFNSSIQGVVNDNSAAVISGATIRITNVATMIHPRAGRRLGHGPRRRLTGRPAVGGRGCPPEGAWFRSPNAPGTLAER